MKAKYFEIGKLIEAVENSFGKSLKVTSDFEKLGHEVLKKCEMHLSPSAIKRVWNFIEGIEKPKRETLDILSLFVGFQNWDAFKSALHGETDADANYVSGELIADKDISVNDKVTVVWQPLNKFVAKYLGSHRFLVLTSDSPMIRKNDIFCCEKFVTGEPLLLKDLVRGDSNACDIIVGGKFGITVSL